MGTIDIRQPDIDRTGAALEALARDLRAMWASALDRGDFDEIARLVEASHAVHRAVLALRADDLIASGHWEEP